MMFPRRMGGHVPSIHAELEFAISLLDISKEAMLCAALSVDVETITATWTTMLDACHVDILFLLWSDGGQLETSSFDDFVQSSALDWGWLPASCCMLVVGRRDVSSVATACVSS